MRIYEIIIEENQRGLLHRDGVLVEYLRPGYHRRRSWRALYDTRRLMLDKLSEPIGNDVSIERVLPTDEGEVVDVPQGTVTLLRLRGIPKLVLPPGRHLVWRASGDVTMESLGLDGLQTTLPIEAWPLATSAMLYDALVQAHERAVLYVDGVLTSVLGPGRHGLSPWQRKLRLARVDMREQELQAQGQELMTADKVSLRLNLIAHYRVVDPQRLVESLESLRDAIYAQVQIVARQTIGAVTVDELLSQRATLAQTMVAQIGPRAHAWGVEMLGLDIKDVILPGEMKALMNQVIEAEKRAAAQVILRREEVAATRSLANTARLLEQNPVLLRLKELETWKELAERVPRLSVVVTSEGIAKQLRLSE